MIAVPMLTFFWLLENRCQNDDAFHYRLTCRGLALDVLAGNSESGIEYNTNFCFFTCTIILTVSNYFGSVFSTMWWLVTCVQPKGVSENFLYVLRGIGRHIKVLSRQSMLEKSREFRNNDVIFPYRPFSKRCHIVKMTKKGLGESITATRKIWCSQE